MFQWIKNLFAKPMPAKQKRKSYGVNLSELALLELKRGGEGTVLELATRLNANAGSVGNAMSQLARDNKVKRAAKRGREIVWELM